MPEQTKTKIRIGLPGRTTEVEVTLPPGEPAPYAEGQERRLTGKTSRRRDGPEKVSGRAVYASDAHPPGMLYGRFVRSPYAHARIVSIDTSRLEKMPGVVFQVLDKKRVRYHGEAVLGLAAPSLREADDAVRAVRVEYEVLPHVVSVQAARRPGAPLVFEKTVSERRTEGDAPQEGQGGAAQNGNVRGPKKSGRGDVEKGFAEAEDTLELTATTSVQTHVCLEPHSLLAEWKGDELHVTASTQGVFSVRDELSEALGLPKDKVHVTTEYMGGGFGSKFGAGDYGVVAAQLAKKAGRPVRMVLSRKSEHLAAGNRPDSINTIKLGFKKDGTITAVRYASFGTAGVATGTGTGSFAKNAYGFPNVAVEESDVSTHLGPGCAMRAPGHPQGAFATETALDAVAERLRLDPLALRLKNDTSDVRRAEWEAGAKAFEWSRRAAVTAANQEAERRGLPLRRGLGCAGSVWYTIMRTGPQALIRVHSDGTVEVENGVQDIGGGIRTAIGLVVAEELGLTPDRIRVKIGRSDYPFGPASGGSTTTTSLIPAVRAAAYKTARKLAEVAAPILGVPAGEVTLADGSLRGGGKSAPFERVCRRLPTDALLVTADRAPDYTGTDDRLFGAQFAEVEVDVETGVVRVRKVVAAHDCGLAVWRTGVENQIRGGILQGISYALFEERIVDERTGRMLNPNIEQYKILGSTDAPEIVPIVLDLYAGKNNGHVRGIGEPATIPTAAAVANAVSHAIGARVLDLPISPARVLAARAAAKGGRA